MYAALAALVIEGAVLGVEPVWRHISLRLQNGVVSTGVPRLAQNAPP